MSSNRWNLLGALLVVTTVLAGCAAGNEATLSYEGTEPGTHEKQLDCDGGDGQLTVAGNVNEGTVTVSVEDSEGRQIYHEQFEGGLDVGSEGLDGAGGRWTLEVERNETFEGNYAVTLVC